MYLKIQEKLVFQTCFLMANRLKFLEILSPQHLLFSLRALFYISPASARGNQLCIKFKSKINKQDTNEMLDEAVAELQGRKEHLLVPHVQTEASPSLQ